MTPVSTEWPETPDRKKADRPGSLRRPGMPFGRRHMMQANQPGMTRALRRSLFAGASGLAVALSLGVGAAAAQTAPQTSPDEVDEVVVTGFRASLSAGLDAKRKEATVVDVIVAEDIADFPDLN